MITFSSNYINQRVRYKFKLKQLESELKKYSEIHQYDYDETVYYFILKVLKNDLFFGKSESELKELLYHAIFWSGLNEYKNSNNKVIKPTRKKTAKEVSVNSKKVNLYTVLQSEVVKSIYRNFDGFDIDENLELYLLIFFECNCVKRKKKEN